MELFNNLLMGLSTALELNNLLFCLIGVVIGTAIGVLPGIGPIPTVALLLPFTFGLSPPSAMIMLAGIFYGAQYGGSTTAILVNVPGETSSVVTCIDGHEMAKQGKAGTALAIAAIASFFAGTTATIVIAVLSVPLSMLALKFTAVEYFSLLVLGLIAAVVLAHGSVAKSLAMVLLGLLLGLVGIDVSSGVARMTFGIPALSDGLDFVPIAMGLFGLGEIIANLERPVERRVVSQSIRSLIPSRADLRAAFPAMVRGTVLGSVLGRVARRRRRAAAVLLLRAGEEAGARSLALRQGRHRGRRRAGGRQQCRRPDQLHSAADARHSRQRADGADDRRADDAGHPARPADHDRATQARLGRHRQHVGRQPDAAGDQPAVDRPLGLDAEDPLSPAVSRPSFCSAASAPMASPTACSMSG